MYNLLYGYFGTILSEKQCGFRKEFIVVKYFLPMIKEFRESLDQDGTYSAILIYYQILLAAFIMSSL